MLVLVPQPGNFVPNFAVVFMIWCQSFYPPIWLFQILHLPNPPPPPRPGAIPAPGAGLFGPARCTPPATVSGPLRGLVSMTTLSSQPSSHTHGVNHTTSEGDRAREWRSDFPTIQQMSRWAGPGVAGPLLCRFPLYRPLQTASAHSGFTVAACRQRPSPVAGLHKTPVRAYSTGAHSHPVCQQKGPDGTCATDEFFFCSHVPIF